MLLLELMLLLVVLLVLVQMLVLWIIQHRRRQQPRHLTALIAPRDIELLHAWHRGSIRRVTVRGVRMMRMARMRRRRCLDGCIEVEIRHGRRVDAHEQRLVARGQRQLLLVRQERVHLVVVRGRRVEHVRE